MGRVLIIGAGGVGRVVLHKCVQAREAFSDICLASQAAGATFFKVDLGPFPNFKRVLDACMANDAFARAHPLKQPGAPAA